MFEGAPMNGTDSTTAPMRLFTPGPVWRPAEVLRAEHGVALYHKSDEFCALVAKVNNHLAALVHAHTTVMLTGSGTMGLEAAIGSLVTEQSNVLVLRAGRYGELLGSIVSTYCSNIYFIDKPWGNELTADDVQRFANEHPSIAVDVCCFVHAETSTGVTVDARAITLVAKACWPECVVVCDAIASVGVHDIDQTGWNIDVLCTASQKGLMCSPGVAIVGLTHRALTHIKALPPARKHRTQVLWLPTIVQANACGLFPSTAPTLVVAGLWAALQRMNNEGLSTVFARHQNVWNVLQTRLQHWQSEGLPITTFGKNSCHAVTVLLVEKPDAMRYALQQRGYYIAGAQNELAQKAIRIGTCGATTVDDIVSLCNEIPACLP
jgi:serine---pyruvate transaminase